MRGLQVYFVTLAIFLLVDLLVRSFRRAFDLTLLLGFHYLFLLLFPCNLRFLLSRLFSLLAFLPSRLFSLFIFLLGRLFSLFLFILGLLFSLFLFLRGRRLFLLFFSLWPLPLSYQLSQHVSCHARQFSLSARQF